MSYSINKIEKLCPLLVCPASGSDINYNKEDNCLINESGEYKYKIENSIPILLKNDANIDSELTNQFDYRSHYNIDSQVFDYFKEKSGGTEHDERRVREAIINHIPKKSDWVLDVGCGCGWVASSLLKKGKNVVSLDISLTNVRKTIELYQSDRHFGVVGDGYALPFKGSYFDCIICSEVIEHTDNPALLASELIRCLKPGGRLILTTPYKEILKYSLCIHCNKPTPHNAHLHSFDKNSLKQIFDITDNINFKWETFSNRASLHLRLYFILRFLNYGMWRLTDKLFNLIINKPAHILVEIDKISDA